VSKLTRISIVHCLLCKPEDIFGELRNFVFPDSSLCFTLYPVLIAYCGELHICSAIVRTQMQLVSCTPCAWRRLNELYLQLY
jgi:hypothetical protein